MPRETMATLRAKLTEAEKLSQATTFLLENAMQKLDELTFDVREIRERLPRTGTIIPVPPGALPITRMERLRRWLWGK